MILSIDAGTQSVRAALVDEKGELHHLVKTTLPPYASPKPGWAEIDPEAYFDALAGTVKKVMAAHAGAIDAVTLTTQRTTVVNVGRDGKPLRPGILWLDQRRADASKVLPRVLNPALAAVGLKSFLEWVVQYSRSNWIREHEPEVWKKTDKFLFLSGYLGMRLTGELRDSAGSVVGPIDLARNPEMHRLAAQFGGSSIVAAAGSEDALVAQAVRDLASTYVPNHQMRTPQQAVAFLGKVQDALDVFFKSFVPLRDGHKQFETKMDIRRGSVRPEGRVAADVAVRRVPDAATLAARVLDWTDPSADASKALAGVFADLMIHQVAMLDGVMRGVKQLLRELSPASLDALFEKKKPSGVTFGPWRFKALWQLYKERHADLADEDTETFELIFGHQFVSAYTQLADVQAVDNKP